MIVSRLSSSVKNFWEPLIFEPACGVLSTQSVPLFFSNILKVGMLLSSVIIACLIHFNKNNSNATFSMTTVIFVLIFVIFFEFGVGPIPPFITSELFLAAQRYDKFIYNVISDKNIYSKVTGMLDHSSSELDFKYDYWCCVPTCQSRYWRT